MYEHRVTKVYYINKAVLLRGGRRSFCERRKGLCRRADLPPVPSGKTKKLSSSLFLTYSYVQRTDNTARSGGRESGVSGFSSARKEKSSKTTKVKEREVLKKPVHRSEQTTASPEGENIVFAKVKHSDGLSWVSPEKGRS